MNKKILLGGLVVLALAVGAWWFLHMNNCPSDMSVCDRQTKGTVVPSTDGLSQYTSHEWGLAFTYPSGWEVKEQIYNKKYTGGNQLASVEVKGNGYSVRFHTIGRGYPTSARTIVTGYVVDGQKTRAFEDVIDGVFWQGISACGGALEISRPSQSKEVTDKIIASIKCNKEE